MNNDLGLLNRLNKPAGPVDVVLDTDTYNEIDDQYALSYLVKSGDKLHLKAVYAAPFFNEKSTGPEDGMEKSYQEILHILTLLEKEEYKERVYKGSAGYLPDEQTPVESAAARHLTELAMEYTPEKPLYVVAIGAITNVASALLMRPEIKERMVLVWLGGNSLEWPDKMCIRDRSNFIFSSCVISYCLSFINSYSDNTFIIAGQNCFIWFD